MIALKQSHDDYDYDIRTLLQAFFSNEKIVNAPNPEARFEFQVSFGTPTHHIAIVDGETILEKTCEGPFEEKMEFRNELKKVVYELLVEYTGKKLPWGTLTGIRPVKICTGLLQQNRTPEQVKVEFMDTYLSSEAKADISVRVAQKEMSIMQMLDYKQQYSLYIGIPFCPSKCLYCSFTSYPIARYQEKVDLYLEALFKEIDFVKEACKDKHLISIYIGGGTPTSISAKQLKKLLDKVEGSFDLRYLKEFTVEAGRPDSITVEKLQVLKDSAMTRMSINPQTMNEETLKLIGRAHTVQQVRDVFEMARDVGIDNINMDMIVGLPGEDIHHVKYTLDEIERMKPDNLTVHSLAIKRAANLNIEMEKYQSLIKGSTNEMLELVDEYAKRLGLEPYYLYRQKNIPGNLENVGYATPGKEGIYNILIMEELQNIIALGAGGSSKFVFGGDQRIERAENVKDVDNYIARVDEMIERKKKWL